MKKKLLFLFVIGLSLQVGFFSSCTKEGTEGEIGITGPQGDKGDKGDKGEQGESGEKGDKGDTGDKGEKGDKGDKGNEGNANVKIYSQNIQNATWTTVGSAADGYQRLVINAPEVLSLNTVRNSVILIYVRSTDYSPNYWALVPYYTHRNVRVDAVVDHRNLTLKKDQNGKPAVPTTFYEVRIVVIESSSSSGPINTAKEPLVDYKDYNAVKEYYNLGKYK